MNRPLHVVVLDHSRDGLAPLLAELQQRGYSTVCRTVTRLEELAAVLDERAWDLIVAHDGLAGNLAFRALDLLRVRGIDIPFILVGSTIPKPATNRACSRPSMPAPTTAWIAISRCASSPPSNANCASRKCGASANASSRSCACARGSRRRSRSSGLLALSGRDLTDLLDRAMDAIRSTLDVELAGLLEALPGGDSFVLRAGVGWRPGLVGEVTIKGGHETFIGDTLKHGQVAVENVGAIGRYSFPQFFIDHYVVSGLSVALHRQDGPTGCLTAYTSRRRMFTRDDALFLQAVANVLAGALERRERGAGAAAEPDAAAERAEDGSDRPARRRHRARLQQSRAGDRRLHGDPAAPAARLRSAAPQRRGDQEGGRSRRRADASAARVQPPAGAAAEGARPEHGRRQHRSAAAASDRRRRRAQDRARERPRSGARGRGADRTGADEPGGQRARRDARRRHADDPHAERRSLVVRSARTVHGDRRAVRPALGRRHRRRHDAGNPRARVRAVLHDEGARPRHRPRALHGLRHRQAERRLHLARQSAGAGDGAAHLSAAREGTRAVGSAPRAAGLGAARHRDGAAGRG